MFDVLTLSSQIPNNGGDLPRRLLPIEVAYVRGKLCACGAVLVV
jgi:hypothetical protein